VKMTSYDDRWAPALARMWNDSDEAWPGGFSGGVPFDADRIKEWMESRDSVAINLAVDRDHVIGFCELVERPDDPEILYVAILNVTPTCHGKGVGKMLLKWCVEKTCDLGYSRLDLDTWSGNMKAVPLYKKIGFFWRPDTSVKMENYIPAIMATPYGKRFFAQHSWYGTQVRNLRVEEDEQEWQGMKSYTYRWEVGSEFLEAVVDREARRIAAIKTPTLEASCRVSKQDATFGSDREARIGLLATEQTGATPGQVTIITTGDDGINCSSRHTVDTTGGQAVELTTAVTLSPEARVKEDNQPAHRLEAQFIMGEDVFTLAAGIRVKEPVTIDLPVEQRSVALGQSRDIAFTLRNDRDEAVTGVIGLTGCSSLGVDPSETDFSLDPYGELAIPVTLRGTDKGGVYALKAYVIVTAIAGRGIEKPLRRSLKTFHLRAMAFGQVLGELEGEAAVVETQNYRLEVAEKGGTVKVLDKHTGQVLCGQTLALVPPSWPNELRETKHQLSMASAEGEGGAIRVTSSAESRKRPGLTVVRETLFTPNGELALKAHLVNASSSAYNIKVQRGYWADHTTGTIYLPLAEGLLVEEYVLGEFPSGGYDLPRNPEGLSENWAALQSGEAVIGLAWPKTDKNAFYRDFLPALEDKVQVEPGQRLDLETHYVKVGSGSWLDARRLWQQHCRSGGHGLQGLDGVGYLDDIVPGAVAGINVAPEPMVPVVESSLGGEFALTLSTVGKRALRGSLKAEFPVELGLVEANSVAEFSGVTRDSGFEMPIRIPAFTSVSPQVGAGSGVRAGVYSVKVNLREELRDQDYRVPLVVTRGSGDTTVEIDDALKGRVDNGVLSFGVDASHCASVYSLTSGGGDNQLNTPYPDVTEYGAVKPWYGGIHPIISIRHWGEETRLAKESLTATAVERRGDGGHHWRGVGLEGTFQWEKLRGLKISVQYLTLPGSNILALVLRLDNSAGARKGFFAGWTIFPRLRTEKGVPIYHYGSGLQGHRFFADQMGIRPVRSLAFPISGTRQVLGVYSCHAINLEDIGKGEIFTGPTARRTTLKAGETKELVTFIVAGSDLEEARAACALSEVKGLFY